MVTSDLFCSLRVPRGNRQHVDGVRVPAPAQQQAWTSGSPSMLLRVCLAERAHTCRKPQLSYSVKRG